MASGTGKREVHQACCRTIGQETAQSRFPSAFPFRKVFAGRGNCIFCHKASEIGSCIVMLQFPASPAALHVGQAMRVLVYDLLLIAYCFLLTTCYLLRTTYSLLPPLLTSYYELLTIATTTTTGAAVRAPTREHRLPCHRLQRCPPIGIATSAGCSHAAPFAVNARGPWPNCWPTLSSIMPTRKSSRRPACGSKRTGTSRR